MGFSGIKFYHLQCSTRVADGVAACSFSCRLSLGRPRFSMVTIPPPISFELHDLAYMVVGNFARNLYVRRSVCASIKFCSCLGGSYDGAHWANPAYRPVCVYGRFCNRSLPSRTHLRYESVPTFVPTTKPYQLLPGIDFDGIRACTGYTCVNR
jgi:hypothetical protein